MKLLRVLAAVVLAGMVRGKGSSTNRTVLVWLYSSQYPTNASWQELYTQISEHSVNMTAVSPCTYLLSKQGAFTAQVSDSVLGLSQHWSSAFSDGLGLDVIPLVAGNPTGVHQLAFNASLQAGFIAAAVTEATKFGYKGYNIDAELPGNSSLADGFVGFLDAFAEALHEQGMVLSVELAGVCRGPDEAGMTCGQLQRSKVDRAVSMATYTSDREEFVKFVVDLSAGLGSKAGVGVEHNQVFEDYEYAMGKLVELGVHEMDFWVGPPPTPNVWDGMGYFLHHA
jgi:hypothetical protein